MGDIEAMFHQVKVPDGQCSFLRFLWWEDCDTNKEIIDYEMTVHVFGGASSQSCSNFALRKTASDNRDEYASDVNKNFRKIFYADDMLNSFQTVTKAKDVIRKVKTFWQREVLTSLSSQAIVKKCQFLMKAEGRMFQMKH